MTPPMLQRGANAAPQTRAQLEALMAQRNELQQQLRNAEERRAQLSVQVQMTPADQRGTLNGRIATLDARIQGLESRIDQLDEAISKATANPAVVGGEGEGGPAIAIPPVPSVPPVHEFPGIPEGPGTWAMVPPGDPRGVHPEIVITGVAVSLALMVMVAWVTWRRAKAKFTRLSGGAVSPDVAQLQQSVDAIAIEVERISEGQRFLTKVLNERAPMAEIAARAEAERVPGRREL